MIELVHVLLLSLAVWRVCRLVIEDTITEPLREKIWSRFPPETSKFGYLFTCYWCTSIYVAIPFTLGYLLIESVTLGVALIFALSAVAGIIQTQLEK